VLSNSSAPPSPSARIHRLAYSLTSSFLRKPRNSTRVPVKSTGIPIVIVENLSALDALRSSRTDHLPLWTILSSIKIVSGGPPPQPRGKPCGDPPAGPASKLRIG